ncbi:hypothetical protein [Nonomuraea sp. NPDC050310]|uniref:hypothetical protein n=1 Tax=Nonomuraea sp. NPDC050310 TaxID=3154935 RepID=UPI00340FD0D4
MSLPALAISVNALRVAEQQRLDSRRVAEQQRSDAQRQKAEEDETVRRAFVQRIIYDGHDGVFFDGGDLVFTNGNTALATTRIQLRFTRDKGAGEAANWTYSLMEFRVPGCTEATFRITKGLEDEIQTEGITFSEVVAEDYASVLNPHDNRWWYVLGFADQVPEPLTPEDHTFQQNQSMSVFTEPDQSRKLSGCA